MENPRTTTARETDDHEMIDAATAETTPAFGSASGGNLQREVASGAEEDELFEPDGKRRAEKSDAIAEGQARPSERRRG